MKKKILNKEQKNDTYKDDLSEIEFQPSFTEGQNRGRNRYSGSNRRFGDRTSIHNGNNRKINADSVPARVSSLVFEEYINDTYDFIEAMASQLRTTDGDKALRITHAVMHAIRDCMPPPEAIRFGQEFPLLIKGLYYDRYDLFGSPLRVRRRDNFIDLVWDSVADPDDFGSPNDVVKALQAFYHVLTRRLNKRQIIGMLRILGPDICEIMISR
jgi:uncharacterized protein (DUF2267 family)